MSGSDVETMLITGFAGKKMQIVCMIIGVDEEIKNYRHPIPWDKRIGKQLMMVLAVRMYGLHIPITRMVHFGEDVPAETQKRFAAVCVIEANSMAACKPGEKFSNILEIQKRWYKETGFEDEWKNHFIGGITGYIPNDSSLCLDKEATVMDGQTFNWFTTITGVNVEDTMIVSGGSREVFTCTGLWPVKAYTAGLEAIELPQILIK
jgi:hypothetical protein